MSSSKADLAGLPPINIYYGADELLAGEALEFADRAKTASLDVSLHSVPAGQHLFLLSAGRSRRRTRRSPR
jgi:epsilon-lactone hydrolase